MLEKAEKVVQLLMKKNESIATMESCTGGGLANLITNIEGASSVIQFSAVTYSNEYKIKMGVSKEIIDQYTVYSHEVAASMAYQISKFTHSDYGVGITGKLKKSDPNNPSNEDDLVFFAIYDKKNDRYYQDSIYVTKDSRVQNKEIVLEKILNELYQVINH